MYTIFNRQFCQTFVEGMHISARVEPQMRMALQLPVILRAEPQMRMNILILLLILIISNSVEKTSSVRVSSKKEVSKSCHLLSVFQFSSDWSFSIRMEVIKYKIIAPQKVTNNIVDFFKLTMFGSIIDRKSRRISCP